MPTNHIKLMTLLMFIYNSLLAYVLVRVTPSPDRLPLLALIAVDYIIIFYYFISVSSRVELFKLARAERNKTRKVSRAKG